MFVYCFFDPDLRVEIIFRKDGIAENGVFDFEIGDKGTSTHWSWRLKKMSGRAYSFFITFFFGDKKLILKTLLTSTFICSLLNSFDLPSYISKWRKRYTLRLLCR